MSITINKGKIEISYRKPHDVAHQRLQELLALEKTRNKKFEPPKKSTDKEKSAALSDTCPVMLHTLNEIRTHFRETPDE